MQQALQNRYFEDLIETCGGNMKAALFFWLISLRYDPEGKMVTVAPCVRLDFAFLRTFEPIYLFTLAELLNHGGLDAGEHGKIFSLSESRSRMILEFLRNVRLAESLGNGADPASRYVINPVFIHAVANTLETANILY